MNQMPLDSQIAYQGAFNFRFTRHPGTKNAPSCSVLLLQNEFQNDMIEIRDGMMFAKSPKKLIIMNILDILKRYTDENHRLSQKEIQDILEREYDMTVERNLMNLIEFGYNINYSESVRIFKDKDGKEQENVILSDFYLEREFTDSELRLLIDSVLFSNHIPYKQDKELVDKLASLSNIYFKKRVNHITRMPEDKTDNKQLFYNVELLDEAIDKRRKVCFHYLEYHTDKKLHKRRNKNGKVREYIINPY